MDIRERLVEGAGSFDAIKWMKAGVAVSAVAAIAAFSAPGAKADALSSSISINGDLTDWGVNVLSGSANGGINGATQYPCGGAVNSATCTNGNTATVPNPPLSNTVNANPAVGQAGGVSTGTSYTVQSGVTEITGATSPQIVAPVTGAVNPFIEDSNDNNGTGSNVGPVQGGQRYDSEFLAVAVKQGTTPGIAGATIYIAYMSGHTTANPANEFGPGDIFITPIVDSTAQKSTTYAVETGSLTAAGTAGTYFTLNGSGYTTAAHTAQTTVGGIYLVDATNAQTNPTTDGGTGNPNDVIDTLFPSTAHGGVDAQYPIQISGSVDGSDLQAMSDYATAVDGDHQIIELAFSASVLAPYMTNLDGTPYSGTGEAYLQFSVYTGPDCGNDVVATQVEIGWQEAPEPGTLAIFAVGLIGLGFPMVRSRRRARAA